MAFRPQEDPFYFEEWFTQNQEFLASNEGRLLLAFIVALASLILSALAFFNSEFREKIERIRERVEEERNNLMHASTELLILAATNISQTEDGPLYLNDQLEILMPWQGTDARGIPFLEELEDDEEDPFDIS